MINAAFYSGTSTPSVVEPGQPPVPTGRVTLTLSDGRTMTLPQTLSADGGRYTNADESIVFWNKGDTAFITENGADTYTNCVTSPVAAAQSPKLAVDLYPLYDGVTWSRTVAETFILGTTTYTGASATSTAIDVGMNPGKAITPFTTYYEKLLKERGWSVANDLAAGGPMGGQDGYRNGSGVILVRYRIDYQNTPKDAPVSCPCTVSFSLFSTVGD